MYNHNLNIGDRVKIPFGYMGHDSPEFKATIKKKLQRMNNYYIVKFDDSKENYNRAIWIPSHWKIGE